MQADLPLQPLHLADLLVLLVINGEKRYYMDLKTIFIRESYPEHWGSKASPLHQLQKSQCFLKTMPDMLLDPGREGMPTMGTSGAHLKLLMKRDLLVLQNHKMRHT